MYALLLLPPALATLGQDGRLPPASSFPAPPDPLDSRDISLSQARGSDPSWWCQCLGNSSASYHLASYLPRERCPPPACIRKDLPPGRLRAVVLTSCDGPIFLFLTASLPLSLSLLPTPVMLGRQFLVPLHASAY